MVARGTETGHLLDGWGLLGYFSFKGWRRWALEGRDQIQQILKPHQQRLTVDLSPFLEPFPGLSGTSLPLGCLLLGLFCCFHSEIVVS